jgi:hypothetical protein
MVPSIYIIESIDHQVELAKELVAKIVLLDSSFEAQDIHIWVLRRNRLLETS